MPKIGKDVLGKRASVRTKKEQEDYEEWKRKKAEEQEEEKQKKQKAKKVIKEKMPEDKEPTPKQLAQQEGEVKEEIRRHKAEEAESEGKSVHVDEHYREPPTQYERSKGITGLTEEEIEERMEEAFPSKKKEKKLV